MVAGPHRTIRTSTRRARRCGHSSAGSVRRVHPDPKITLFYPWNNGLKVDQIESDYDAYKFPDGHDFYDWTHS